MKTMLILFAALIAVSGCVLNSAPEPQGCPQGHVLPDGRCNGPITGNGKIVR